MTFSPEVEKKEETKVITSPKVRRNSPQFVKIEEAKVSISPKIKEFPAPDTFRSSDFNTDRKLLDEENKYPL